jgi:hypothetical protein
MNPIQVLQYSRDQCIIYTPPNRIGIYYGAVMHAIFLATVIWGRYSRFGKTRVNWKALPFFYCVFCVAIPLLLSGSSYKATFSRSDGIVTVASRFMLIPRKQTITLDKVTDAAVGGENNRLFLNLKDGGQVGLSFDSAIVGRESACNTINSWLKEYQMVLRGPGNPKNRSGILSQINSSDD